MDVGKGDTAQFQSHSSTHGRRRIFSRGDKKLHSGRGTTKKTRGAGLFSKLRVWVGKGLKEKFSSATAILGFFLKNKNI